MHSFFKDESHHRSVNQLLKRLVWEGRWADVRALHQKVRIYVTGFGRTAGHSDFKPHRGRYGSKLKGGKKLYANTF